MSERGGKRGKSKKSKNLGYCGGIRFWRARRRFVKSERKRNFRVMSQEYVEPVTEEINLMPSRESLITVFKSRKIRVKGNPNVILIRKGGKNKLDHYMAKHWKDVMCLQARAVRPQSEDAEGAVPFSESAAATDPEIL